MKKYKMVYDGDSFIDSVVHDNLESAISDAEETLLEWGLDMAQTWEFKEGNNLPSPTPEQIEQWDYMIYNCGCYVVAYDDETGEQGDYLDDALWPASQEQLDALGWMLWEDVLKKYGGAENAQA